MHPIPSGVGSTNRIHKVLCDILAVHLTVEQRQSFAGIIDQDDGSFVDYARPVPDDDQKIEERKYEPGAVAAAAAAIPRLPQMDPVGSLVPAVAPLSLSAAPLPPPAIPLPSAASAALANNVTMEQVQTIHQQFMEEMRYLFEARLPPALGTNAVVAPQLLQPSIVQQQQSAPQPQRSPNRPQRAVYQSAEQQRLNERAAGRSAVASAVLPEQLSSANRALQLPASVSRSGPCQPPNSVSAFAIPAAAGTGSALNMGLAEDIYGDERALLNDVIGDQPVAPLSVTDPGNLLTAYGVDGVRIYPLVVAKLGASSTFTEWTDHHATFKDSRNKFECLSLARTLDDARALLNSCSLDNRESVLDLMERTVRRFVGVHMADKTGTWSMCNVLELDQTSDSLLPFRYLASVLRAGNTLDRLKPTSAYSRINHNNRQGGAAALAGRAGRGRYQHQRFAPYAQVRNRVGAFLCVCN
jgi:hypothetical protein